MYKVVDSENQRRKEEAEKEEDNRLWIAYVHSMETKSFLEWKRGLKAEPQQKQGKEPEVKSSGLSMTEEQVEEAKQRARGILKDFSPN